MKEKGKRDVSLTSENKEERSEGRGRSGINDDSFIMANKRQRLQWCVVDWAEEEKYWRVNHEVVTENNDIKIIITHFDVHITTRV